MSCGPSSIALPKRSTFLRPGNIYEVAVPPLKAVCNRAQGAQAPTHAQGHVTHHLPLPTRYRTLRHAHTLDTRRPNLPSASCAVLCRDTRMYGRRR